MGRHGAYAAARRTICRGYTDIHSLAVNGDDLKLLGITGAEIGRTLSRLLRLVNSGEAENDREALLKRI